MRILICHERFLFRFGVDRVLIMLGKGLRDRGHIVSIMGNRFDREIVQTFASQIIDVPTNVDDYLNLNEFTSEWLQHNWDQHFDLNSTPDIVLVAGWPFFSAIPFFRKVCRTVIFSDHGLVPLKGYTSNHLVVLKKLKSLRQKYLNQASAIIGVSDFIVNSQSRVDSYCRVKVYSILNGADHMEMSIWPGKHLHLENSHSNGVDTLNSLKRKGEKAILCLGRWEPNCYKNSDATFDIMQRITSVFPDCALLILAEQSNANLPIAFKDSIFPIGFPDDEELLEIMKHVDLGISCSLWEGFNLPLAEMQWLGRPALVFDLAAHPEVVLHPWYLCKDNAEMAVKACDILSGRGPDADMRAQSLKKFRSYFRWDRVVQDYCEIFEKIIREDMIVEDRELTSKDKPISLIVDVTNSTRDPANSGVIRVTRCLCRELQRYADLIFVVWDQKANCHVLPTRKEFQQLSQFNGPLLTDERRLSPDEHKVTLDDFLSTYEKKSMWLLFSETINETYASKIRHYAKEHGIHLAATFYDALPVIHPELCKDITIRNNHRDYMRGLAECDVVVPISNFSSQCLKDFWKDNNIQGGFVFPNVLPGEFGCYSRNQKIQNPSSGEVQILCVSTLEPRKNHLKLVQACLIMQEKHPDLNWSLTLVGNRYVGAYEIADTIQSISAKNPRIKWLGIVDDATLHRLYEEASFTVYPSMIEGFGMPIMESLWHGRPCICYREGVMAELAAEGGCLTTDVMNEKALYEIIYRLATDKELLLKLSQEAVTRNIKTWDDYTRKFISILESQNKTINTYTSQDKNTVQKSPILDKRNWEDILYPGCLCNHWQMSNSERLAMTALLSRHKPRCSIEVGTYQGGSLSLISQYSEMVFSIDIDPSISEKFKQFKHVSFFTGPSGVILPLLLKALDESDIPVDFIFVDGDYTAEGIKQDINIVLSYVPQKPLFVIMHDSFNPACRRGMLEADWEKSAYVQWLDIDFIPGRIIEHGGGGNGEMWGGLGMAYLLPSPRTKPLQVMSSAGVMFTKIKALQYK